MLLQDFKFSIMQVGERKQDGVNVTQLIKITCHVALLVKFGTYARRKIKSLCKDMY